MSLNISFDKIPFASNCVAFIKKNPKMVALGVATVIIASLGRELLDYYRVSRSISAYDHINGVSAMMGSMSRAKKLECIQQMELEIPGRNERNIFMQTLVQQYLDVRTRRPDYSMSVNGFHSVLPAGRTPHNFAQYVTDGETAFRSRMSGQWYDNGRLIDWNVFG